VCATAVFVSICVSPGGNSLRCLMHERQMKNELNTVANYMDQKANFEGGFVEGGRGLLCSGNLHADLQNWILEWPAFKAHAQLKVQSKWPLTEGN